MARYIKSGDVARVPEINAELEKIATAQQDFVTRSGESPNEMLNTLDMNNNRITNLPAPVSGNDAARFADVGGGTFTVLTDEALVFDNILEMTTANLSVGQYVRCKRYYSGGELVDGLVYEIQVPATVDNYIDHNITNGNIAVLITNCYLNVEQAGAVGDGITDDIVPIRAAVAYSKAAGLKIKFKSGKVYGITDSIENLTSSPLSLSEVNGINISSDSLNTAEIKALAGFPAGSALINLDGNVNNESTSANAVIQSWNLIENIYLNGNNIAFRGIRLRAINYSTFNNILMKDFVGTSSDAAIIVQSTASAGQDDADTTAHCTFNSIKIDNCNGYGFLCVENRCATMVFNNCDVRNCDYDGMRIAFAGLALNSCTFAINGSSISSETGGFSAVTPLTSSINRGLVLNASQFEANYNYDLNIESVLGFKINSGLWTPFVRAVSGQILVKIGNGTGRVDGGVIDSPRVAAYATTGEVISGVVVGPNAQNIAINNISFSDAGSNWDTLEQRFTISSNSSNIKVDGSDASPNSNRVGFSVNLLTNANDIANLTGDGTEYKSSDLSAITTTIIPVNNGPQRLKNTITSGSISGDILTVASITGTPLRVGNLLVDSDILENTFITEIVSASGGTGTYRVSRSQAVSPQSIRVFSRQWYDRVTGTFTAPETAFYQFESAWCLTGFNGSETDIEVAIVVNPSGTPIRHIVFKVTPKTLVATDINTYGGSKIIYLNKGDDVVTSVKVSGTTKTVNIYRDIAQPNGYIFTGVSL